MVCVTPFRGWFGGVCTRVGSTYVWEWAPRGFYPLDPCQGSAPGPHQGPLIRPLDPTLILVRNDVWFSTPPFPKTRANKNKPWTHSTPLKFSNIILAKSMHQIPGIELINCIFFSSSLRHPVCTFYLSLFHLFNSKINGNSQSGSGVYFRKER